MNSVDYLLNVVVVVVVMTLPQTFRRGSNYVGVGVGVDETSPQSLSKRQIFFPKLSKGGGKYLKISVNKRSQWPLKHPTFEKLLKSFVVTNASSRSPRKLRPIL